MSSGIFDDKDLMKMRLLFLFGVITLSSILNAQVPQNQPWRPPVYGEQVGMGYDANTFAIPEALKEEVNFWIKIYTHYTTHQGVFHVAGGINQILGEIDLTDVHLNPKWGPIRREKEAELIIKRQRQRIAKEKKMDIKNIRLQMGLKDRMQKAIYESGKYLPMMEEIFEKHKLPKELTRVVFVESSFNTLAKSKVGASGLWQIMPAVGRKYKYLHKSYDKRDHPQYATELAADIFKQNYRILKSWPLAVTSYNFGVGRMMKVRKKLKASDAQGIFGSQKLKKHIGFASRNFYATFLAALHVEAHANIYFGEPFMVAQPLKLKHIYLTRNTKFEEIVKKHNLENQEFKKLNVHIESRLLRKGRVLPKGTLVSVPVEDSREKVADSDN